MTGFVPAGSLSGTPFGSKDDPAGLARLLARSSAWSVQALPDGRFRLFFSPRETVEEHDPAQLAGALARDMERACSQQLWWAGVLAYEAAVAFESGLAGVFPQASRRTGQDTVAKVGTGESGGCGAGLEDVDTPGTDSKGGGTERAGTVEYDTREAGTSAAGPLARWGIFDQILDLGLADLARLADGLADLEGIDALDRLPLLGPPRPDWELETYASAFAGVRAGLQAGTSYQMNLTFSSRACLGLPGQPDQAALRRQSTQADHAGTSAPSGFCTDSVGTGETFAGPSFPWWAFMLWTRLLSGGQGRHAAWWYSASMHGDGWIASLSPELFFSLQGQEVECRPMKGTAPRSSDPDQDRKLAVELASSPKNQAENLMIVDMIRNDLGRVAVPGSVRVQRLFQVESYPTVHQMTSTITARVDCGPAGVLAALFPCASITGAPKIATIKALAALEDRPRGWYTGSAGWVDPQGNTSFNVLIRNLLPGWPGHREVRLDSGGGVVWDSVAEDEYREALVKLEFCRAAGTAFDLVESLRLCRGGCPAVLAPDGVAEALGTPVPGTGWTWLLLEEHLDRLASSARRLGRQVDKEGVRKALQEWAASLAASLSGQESPDHSADHATPRTKDATQVFAVIQTDLAVPGHITALGVPVRDLPLPARAGMPDLKVRLALDAGGKISIDSSGLEKAFNGEAPVLTALSPWPLTVEGAGALPLAHKTSDRQVHHDLEQPGYGQTISWDSTGRVLESTTCNVVIRRGAEWLTPVKSSLFLGGTYRRRLLEDGRIQEADLALTDLLTADGVWLVNSVRGWMPADLAKSRPQSR